MDGVWSCGFDMAGTSNTYFSILGLTFAGSSGGFSTTTTPYGFGSSMSLTGATVTLPFLVNLTTHFNNIKIFVVLPTSGSVILLQWQDMTAGAAQVTLRVFSDGSLRFFLGTGTGTPLGPASAIGLVSTNTWIGIETKVVINAATGAVECKLDGAAACISASGLNTVSTANVWVSGILLVGTNATFFDDWVMLDGTAAAPLNTHIGVVQVKGEKSTANSAVGGRNAFTPTNPQNDNHLNVGNIPQNAAQFNSDSTPGDYDMFQFGSLSALQVFFLTLWDLSVLDAAGARTIGLNCYLAGTDSLGHAVAPAVAGSPKMIPQAYVLDPSGATWTVPNAQSAELGVKVIT
jgi:hypothetical protein